MYSVENYSMADAFIDVWKVENFLTFEGSIGPTAMHANQQLILPTDDTPSVTPFKIYGDGRR